MIIPRTYSHSDRNAPCPVRTPCNPACFFISLRSEEKSALTAWASDDVFQKSVLRSHQSSPSPVHSVLKLRGLSRSHTLSKLIAEIKRTGRGFVGGMEKTMVTLRPALLYTSSSVARRLCQVRWAPSSPARTRVRTDSDSWTQTGTGISCAVRSAMETERARHTILWHVQRWKQLDWQTKQTFLKLNVLLTLLLCALPTWCRGCGIT